MENGAKHEAVLTEVDSDFRRVLYSADSIKLAFDDLECGTDVKNGVESSSNSDSAALVNGLLAIAEGCEPTPVRSVRRGSDSQSSYASVCSPVVELASVLVQPNARLYRFRGLSLGLVLSYMRSRVQRVYINDERSSGSAVSMGVPQGSVFGPFPFIVYINDLPHFVKNERRIVLLVDDTSLLFKANRQQLDFEEICRYFTARLLAQGDASSANGERWLVDHTGHGWHEAARLVYDFARLPRIGRAEPRGLALHLSVSDATYEIARNFLRFRFQNSPLVDSCISNILNLPSVAGAKYRLLMHFLNPLPTATKSLKKLGLPYCNDPQFLPTYNHLVEFLEKKCRLLDNVPLDIRGMNGNADRLVIPDQQADVNARRSYKMLRIPQQLTSALKT
ncbi:hypothetical protein EVAR_52276_1 [Eumeta japonica]|uniref:Uncharacterized protein n=1 Tax=Eumeta variegata TaxID=151549 RepID=A0A4C1YTF6_EUMVA|nr:hypothetical protein EVAR_52276_1 [Eumeta japonica]